MDEQVKKTLENSGIQYLPPYQGSYRLVAQFNPLRRNDYRQNFVYEDRIKKLFETINFDQALLNMQSPKGEEIRGKDGRRILRLFNTPYNREGQLQMEKFMEFSKENQYFSFDIETLGNAVDKTNFSVTEIAIQGFKKEGNEFKATDQKLTQLIAPSEKVQKELRTILDQLRRDKYSFNSLTEWQKRTIVDATRYSTFDGKESKGATFNIENGRVTDFTHNTFTHLVMDESDNIIDSRVIDHMNELITHVESGLQTLNSIGMKAEKAIEEYKNFLIKHKDHYFASYNGDTFDLPALQAWGSQYNQVINNPEKHLDYYRVVQTVYPNAAKLHEELGRNLEEDPFVTGMNRLQEFRKTLGFELEKAHSALHDIGEEGLGGFINQSMKTIQDKILQSKTNLKEGFNAHDTVFSWVDQPLKIGQQLFAAGGVQAFREGELSFTARLNPETNQFELNSTAFNTTIIRSKTFYEVQGLVDFSDETTQRIGLQLYDSTNDLYTFIVREGENAFDELASFIQNRFYNWDGLDSELQRKLYEYKITDSARRRHQRMFSLEKAGNGKTGGYEAARRLYENAAILEKRIMGKYKFIKGDEYRERLKDRMTHEQLMKELEGRFNSLWDAKNKKWVHNAREQEDFFRMGMRLISERPVYEKALQYIGEQLEDPQQRDLAWNIYYRKLQDYMARNNIKEPTELVELQDFEKHRISFQDFDSDTQHILNAETLESTERSINRYIYTPDIYNQDVDAQYKEDRYRERMNRLIKNLEKNQIITREIAANYQRINASGTKVHDTIVMLADTIYQSELQVNQSIKQMSLGYNTAMDYIDDDLNKLLMREAVEDVKSIRNVSFNPQQLPGTRIIFNDYLEEQLSKLDQRHLSGLNPNNRASLEKVLADLQEYFPKYHYALSLDENTLNAKISVFRPENSTSVIEHLVQGKSHPKALEIIMPLINSNGVHTIGNRRINARSIGELEEKGENAKIVYKSTIEAIADDYSRNLRRIMKPFEEGNVELANRRSRQVLNESVEQLSGIQRNLVFNDGYLYSNNFSDFLKQGQVEMESVMIHDWFYNPKKPLTEKDFLNKDVFDQNGNLKRDVSFDDLSPRKAYEMLLAADDWLKEKNITLYAGSNKAEHVAHNIWNQQNIRDYIPYGHYTFQGRDNSVQYQSVHVIDREVADNLLNVVKGTNTYLNFNDLVTTKAFDAWKNQWKQRGDYYTGVNLKVAFMNDDQLMQRLEELKQTEHGFQLLRKEGIINEDGSWIHPRVPRIYEQQGLIVKDIQDNLKVTEQKILSETDNVEFHSGVEEGSIVKPGDIIGYETINGQKRTIRWQGKHDATILVQNGRVAAKWTETPFKYIVEGEKATDIPVSRELLTTIIGDDSVGLVLNPNIKKHHDFSLYMTGKAKLLADYTQQLHEDLSLLKSKTHPNDKASKTAMERDDLQKQFDRTIRMARKIGLEWDGQRYIQTENKKIPTSRFERILDALGIQRETSLGFDTGIYELRLSKVSNYSKMVDETGHQVLRMYHDENGNLKKIYKVGENGEPIRSGVQWGHREMGVLRDLGLTKTYDFVFNAMMEQAKETGGTINRLQETKNMVAALTSFVNPEHELVDQAPAIGLEKFRSLPEFNSDIYDYSKTIFDQNYIQELLQGKGAAQHGYWLELPGIDEKNGLTREVTINLHGKKPDKGINKIFIPFTNLEGANGDIHLREIQKNIADIYRRAEEVTKAKSYQERNEAINRMQESVNRYYRQLTKDISASKGQVGESVLKARMKNSGSGLFKLLDPAVSMDLDGEYTFISEEDAKALGVYDRLKEIEAKRAAGEAVEDLMVMNVRYPTFHSKAMQATKLRMDSRIRPGEFHTTAWASNLMEADSDGDYDHIVVMDDEDIQKEWRELHDRRQEDIDKKYQSLLEKESRKGRKFTPGYITKGATHFSPFASNTQDEIAAKIGKRIIGLASNLNLFMRQVSDEYLDHDSEERKAIHEFGQQIEQKLISSKHGVIVESGRAPAIEFIQAIYNRDWNTARDLHEQFFADDFDKDLMEKAFSGLDQSAQNLRKGLRSPILRFGTSHGISPDIGIKKIVDYIHGNGQLDETVLTNPFLNLLQRALGIKAEKTYTDLNGKVHRKVDPYRSIEEKPKKPREESIPEIAGEYVHDLAGGSEKLGNKVQETLEKVSKNKRAKWGFIAGALALGGIAGYNILKRKEPLMPLESSRQEDDSYQEPQPVLMPLSNDSQEYVNANIEIHAKGRGHSPEDLSYMVNQGVQYSNMNSGNQKITIHHHDNTAKLNRIWYRDKIQENIKDNNN